MTTRRQQLLDFFDTNPKTLTQFCDAIGEPCTEKAAANTAGRLVKAGLLKTKRIYRNSRWVNSYFVSTKSYSDKFNQALHSMVKGAE